MTVDEFLNSETDVLPVRKMAYGPVVGEHHDAAMFGPDRNPLGKTDVAASPDTGLGQGDLIMAEDGTLHTVADWSYYHPNQPTHGTIEFRDRQDQGRGFIKKVNSVDDFLGLSQKADGTTKDAPAGASTVSSIDGFLGIEKPKEIIPSSKVVPTASEQSTLEAPEGSPQREEINKSVAGNLFAPPGKFARDPTLSELVSSALPRSVQESQMQEKRIPLAPPLPEQGAFEQGGVLGVTIPAVEAGGEMVGAMMPHDWRSYLAQIYPPMAAGEIGGRLSQGDISDIPLVGRIPEIIRAEQTPGFSKERYMTALRTLMDVGGLAAGGERAPLPLRTEPLAPEPPPTQSMGPGTIAGDVSKALERRFTLQEPPPEVPDIAPPPPIEDTLANIPKEPPVFNPEPVPQTIPESTMPLATEPAVDIAALQARKAKIEASIAPSKAIGQRTAYDEELAGINGQLGVPPEGPVQAPETPATASEAPGGVPVAEPAASTPAVEKPPVQTDLPESGFSTERAQKIYGDDAVLITKGKSAKAWKAIGQADKRDPYAVMTKARARGIATPEDAALFRAEHDRLLAHAREAYGTPEYGDRAQNAVDFLNASKEVAHGPASDIMRGLQEADKPRYDSPADYDNILRERQMQATPDETATFLNVADEVRTKDSEARTEAANGQEALKKYKPGEVVPFDEASNYIKKEIKKLTEPCVL